MRDEAEIHLVLKAIRHDREAFTTLYNANVDRVYKHVFFRVSQQPIAEDITQDVFIRAWKAIPRFKDRGFPFIAWLIAIADNLIIDFYKERNKYANVDVTNIRSTVDIAENAEISFTKKNVREAINKLTDMKRIVILMHFIEGFSYLEIARFLKKSEGAIRIIQYRALKDLKEIISVDYPNEERDYTG